MVTQNAFKMSQRALKKRESNLLKQEKESHQIYRKHAQPLAAQKSKYTQRIATNTAISKYAASKANHIESAGKSNIYVSRRKFSSTPNLASNQSEKWNGMSRSHSESDLSNIPEANALVNARSEFHLKSIASTDVPRLNQLKMNTTTFSDRRIERKTLATQQSASNVQSKSASVQNGGNAQIGGSMNASVVFHSTASPALAIADTEHIHIPIIGYEVMEERARFTVMSQKLSFNFDLIFLILFFHF